MSARVVIVGAGVAGTAAAWALRRAAGQGRPGREVLVLDGGLGASGLGGGAVDDVPWEELARAERALGVGAPASRVDFAVRAFAQELGLWSLPEQSRWLIATTAGRVRPARGADAALLDLGGLAGRRIGLPRAERAGWDADSLARALAAEPTLAARSFELKPIDAVLFRHRGHDAYPDAELAGLLDEPAHLAWLAERLREALARTPVDALLVGPWLGLDPGRAAALSERVGVPVGEALSATGTTAGLRFERARDRLLARVHVTVQRGRVMALARRDAGFELGLADGSTLRADEVILALGGVAGGGVVYEPTERSAGRDMPARARLPFRLSLDAALPLRWGGGELDVGGSLFGLDLDEGLWPAGPLGGPLERVGLDPHPLDGVRAVGDLVADRPRTLLAAVASALAVV